MKMKKISFEEMENIEGGMPCWASSVLLVAAGISFTVGGLATGGALWGTLALNTIGLSGSFYGYLESCYPDLLE